MVLIWFWMSRISFADEMVILVNYRMNAGEVFLVRGKVFAARLERSAGCRDGFFVPSLDLEILF